MTFQKLQLIKEMITLMITDCLLKKHYEMIAIDLGKQQPLDADPKSNTIN